MESSIKTAKGLKRKLELKIKAKEAEGFFLKRYQKIQKTAKISGFREGKAPLNTIKQIYKDKILKDVLDDLFRFHYPSALENTKLNPAGPPSLLDCNLQEGKDASILLELEVHPTVKVENYLDLELEKKTVSVTEEQMSQSLEKLRDSSPIFEDAVFYTGPLKKGDFCALSLSAFDSQNKKILNYEELVLEIGADTMGKGFDKNLLGLNKDQEREFDFHFPKQLFNSQIQNPNLRVKVKLIAFKNKKTSELNDEFAQKFKAANMKELKAKIKQDLKQNLEQKAQENLENHLLEQLAEKNPLELPEVLIEDQKQRLKENTKKHLQMYQVSPEDQELYLQKHEKEFQKEAEFSLHISYLVEKLIKDLNIKTSSEDITASLKESFPNKKPEDMEKELKKNKYWNQFLSHLTRKKLIAHLLENAKIR